jgi:hypothetical protein
MEGALPEWPARQPIAWEVRQLYAQPVQHPYPPIGFAQVCHILQFLQCEIIVKTVLSRFYAGMTVALRWGRGFGPCRAQSLRYPLALHQPSSWNRNNRHSFDLARLSAPLKRRTIRHSSRSAPIARHSRGNGEEAAPGWGNNLRRQRRPPPADIHVRAREVRLPTISRKLGTAGR